MSGTLEGGRAAAKTIKEKHGEDFYKRIGAMPHKRGEGFKNRERARTAGALGGRKSRRVQKDEPSS